MGASYEAYKRIRDRQGLSDYRICQDTRIGQSTMTDWKNGRSKPGIDKLSTIAKYLGVQVGALID